jgi:hypothetical protein
MRNVMDYSNKYFGKEVIVDIQVKLKQDDMTPEEIEEWEHFTKIIEEACSKAEKIIKANTDIRGD